MSRIEVSYLTIEEQHRPEGNVWSGGRGPAHDGQVGQTRADLAGGHVPWMCPPAMELDEAADREQARMKELHPIDLLFNKLKEYGGSKEVTAGM